MDFQDILESGNRTAGYRDHIYIIEASKIPAFPAITANSNLISAPFVPEVGSGFYKIPISDISGKATYGEENAGDADNPSRNSTFTAYHPGRDSVTSYYLDQVNGKKCYILLGDKGNCNEAGDPIYQVLGSRCGGVTVRTKHDNDGTVKGYTITAEGYNVNLPLDYDQVIPV